MSSQFETPGMFSWFELMTDDVERSKHFYGKLLDWEFEQDSNNKEYTLIKVKGIDHPIAGIFDRRKALVQNPQAILPHWGNYITVKNIDELISKVEKMDGKIIVAVTEIPKVGKFSVIQDPQGAVISLMEYIVCEI
jgi:uncharacterized protein